MSATADARFVDRAQCSCAEWHDPLRTWEDVQKRMASFAASELERTLRLVAQGNWIAVYDCRICGQHWAKEFPLSEMHGGGPQCVYAIDTDDPVRC